MIMIIIINKNKEEHDYISEAVGVSIKARSPPASLLLNTPETTIT